MSNVLAVISLVVGVGRKNVERNVDAIADGCTRTWKSKEQTLNLNFLDLTNFLLDSRSVLNNLFYIYINYYFHARPRCGILNMKLKVLDL